MHGSRQVGIRRGAACRAAPRAVSRCLVLLALLVLGDLPAQAGRFTDLYDDAVLEHWQPRYRKGVLGNLDNVLLPRLTAPERQRLARLELEFPLRGAEDHPLSFYAHRDGTVTLPVLSLKFFDDLSIALAWLWRQGYSLETAMEYVSMLKYREPAHFGGRYPPPLEALRIPPDALDDSGTDDMAQKIFKTAVVFVLLHEMGHVLYDHPGYGPGVERADARANEAEADAFALEVMRRLGVAPFGMVFFFQSLAHIGLNRGDFGSDGDYERHLARDTHPLTEARLAALAAALRADIDAFAQEFTDPASGREAVAYVAAEIAKVADFLADRDLQRLIAEVGRNTGLASLAPRRPGEKLGLPTPSRRDPGATAEPFDGVYDGALTSAGVSFPVRFILRRDGELVSGQYSYGVGAGRLRGTLRDGGLDYEWQAQGQRGRGRLVPDGAGGLVGRWGHGTSAEGGGSVAARRIPE